MGKWRVISGLWRWGFNGGDQREVNDQNRLMGFHGRWSGLKWAFESSNEWLESSMGT
jgi:hypothetical protein